MFSGKDSGSSLYQRILSLIKAGLGASGNSATYSRGGLTPNEENDRDDQNWDAFNQRLYRYRVYGHYYNNTVFSTLNEYALRIRKDEKLYKHIRQIYNPVNRYVELHITKIFGGGINPSEPMTGAVPLEYTTPALADAAMKLMMDSNWQRRKSLYVRYGAKLGDSFLKLVDDTDAERILMQPIHPSWVKHMDVDPTGKVTAAIIEYRRSDNPNDSASEYYTYTEAITPEFFATFRNGEPWAYFEDASGKPLQQWDNIYGFVPLVHTPHQDIGNLFGQTGFAQTLSKVNEINDQASIINDNIRKHVNSVWAMVGASKGSITTPDGNRDSVPILYMPGGTNPVPLVLPLQIADATANLIHMLDELESDLPELALSKLRRTQTQVSEPGVTAVSDDGVERIVESRGNYDAGLATALRMGIAMGGERGYAAYRGFNAQSYLTGALDELSIRDRPVLRDKLTLKERVTALKEGGASLELQLREMGYDEEIIAKEVENERARAASEAAVMAASLFGGPDDPDENDGDGTPQDVDDQEPGKNEADDNEDQTA